MRLHDRGVMIVQDDFGFFQIKRVRRDVGVVISPSHSSKGRCDVLGPAITGELLAHTWART